ncbi:MAG: AAA family ATPase [Chloroflexota bacterium]|nr:AAA family ATPase [Chloroflexota bacterium]
MQQRPEFVDRDDEVRDLHRLADSGQKQLGILYGRRQVGKTYLLEQAWGDRRVFYFLLAEQAPDLNRQELLRDLSTWSGTTYDPADYPTWRTVFRALIDLANDGPVVVVLDEFQYILGNNEVTSHLVAAWDPAPKNRPITLMLAGSEISTMSHLEAGSEPLFGRITWSSRLYPFDYRDAARMAPHLGPRDAAYLYGIFGGSPRYLAALDEGEPLARGVARTFVSPRGEVHLQMLSLLEQERGLRDLADYRSLLATAARSAELKDVVEATKIEEYVARRKLETLEDLTLVRRERNFEASAKQPYRYSVADNALAFWYSFVFPNRSRLVRGAPEAFWSAVIGPRLDSYMGRIFKGMVREAYQRYAARWSLPGIKTWGQWEGVDRDRQSVELDITSRTDDGRLLVGEVKWSTEPRGPSLHTGVLDKLSRLAVSGQGWAKDVQSAVFLYVSAAGFAPEMTALQQADPRVHCLNLADLYPDD